MEERTRALRRFNDRNKARRKKRISDDFFIMTGFSYYDNLHQYSKNKIHCSCPLCRAKTKNKGKRRKCSSAPSYNPTIAEIKLNDRLNSSLKDYFLDEYN